MVSAHPELLVRLDAIGAVMLSVTGAFAYTGGWPSPARLTQDRLMAAFRDANGRDPTTGEPSNENRDVPDCKS
ncbi:hypothetical protein UP10_32550 [Bradyrhizobium sp. LTSPM299]|uniref:hypothetical protein n=1 Tax=Bradyrhizobium sp. LTSPM299 TaxID=1619233 RepID=UPI0005C96705|nr:hypothetical protein [Bradyrhizobium sp. LTSPM299]KJC56693.1 hypothetical protein UP10_32550 [Bradyrhizobium sp. LTSPM299]